MSVVALNASSSNNVKSQMISDSKFIKTDAEFSPDGRFIAYGSNESGIQGIYLQEFPGPGRKLMIAADATQPRWARRGKELFYRSGSRMMAVDVETSPTLRVGKPRVLFETTTRPGYRQGYDVAPDGSRFLMVKEPPEQASSDQLHIVVNWFTELQQRVPLK